MKTKSFLHIAFIASTFLWPCTVFGQQIFGDSISKKFEQYRTTNLQEKIFVHIDQNFFLVGETAWFKVYCVDGTFHKPLDVSKVAYVEILDKMNKSVIQGKLELKNGAGNGSFFLPATLESGKYAFRCYTNWMKNYSPEFYFHQDITIVNPFVQPEVEKADPSHTLHVDFFPEGGHLVTGLPSKVGFKITDGSGKFVQSKIAIVNEANDTIVSAMPLKFGLGNFSITPSSQARYRGIVSDRSGKITVHPFPKVEESGYVMTLSDNPKTLSISVSGNFNDNNVPDQVFLFRHSRNRLLKFEARNFKSQKAEFAIEKDQLADGINHFTLFDENQQPVCERLYFKTPQKKLSLSIAEPNSEYTTRRKLSLPIAATVGTKASITTLSVAVIRKDSISDEDQQDIHSYLWLSSDIKGVIESPEFYFSTGDETVRQATDNLMITQGWRRFSWDDILKRKNTRNHTAEFRGHVIQGRVTRKTDSLAQGFLTFLSSPGKIINLYSSRSDKNGIVQFEPSEFTGMHKLILQAEPEQSNLVNLEIISPFSMQYRSKPAVPFKLPVNIKKDFLDRTIAMQVQDVFYDESSQQTAPEIDSVGFYGVADETYYLDNYTRFPVMEEVMREYVPGVFVRKRKESFHFIVLDAVNGGVLNGEPMILLDGVPLFSADKIMAIDPRVIRKLEVVKRKYFLGPLTMNGIVSYTSYQGDLMGLEANPGSITLNYEGLQLKREFYSPRYDTQKQIDSRLPDRRYLLYWNPSLTPKKDGTYDLEFYTSDVKGTFEIVVQGIDGSGNAACSTKTFLVR